MIDDIKAFGLWVWNWITVLTASILGSLSTAFELLDLIGAVDWTTIMPADTAGKIVTIVAIVKGLVAWYMNSKKDEADA